MPGLRHLMAAWADRRHHATLGEDVSGWTLDPGLLHDPRTPKRSEAPPGPWADETGRPAHGIYHRPHPCGLTDWAAAADGWLLWRWRGPRMNWSSPLVSPWNPILAQDLVLDHLEQSG